MKTARKGRNRYPREGLATGMCPSWLLNAKLEKVVSSLTESLGKLDAAEATRNTCSKAEAWPEENGGTFQMR